MALHTNIQEESIHSLEFNKPLKYCVYGNCQAENLHHYLDCSPKFKSTFTYHHIPGIYQLTQSDVDFVELVMSDCDLIISQKIGRNYGRLSTQHLFEERLLKPTCTRISFPSLYFRGYNPELHPPHYDESIMYNHIINFSNASHFEEVFLNLSLFEKSVSLWYVEESLNELGLRESDIDIKISDFIRYNYRKQRLFHTFNHPTSGLMAEIAGMVLEKIGFDDFSKENARNISCSILSNFHFPLYQSHAQNLDIEFSENILYRYAGQDYNMREFYNLMRKTIKPAIKNNQIDPILLSITHLKLRIEFLNTTQKINEFVGYIDQIADHQIKGWVCNRNDYDDSLDVDIYQDGIKLDTVNAELYRPDIKDAGYGTGNYGFCYDTPVFLKSSLIVVKVANSDYELPRSEMSADNLLSHFQTANQLKQKGHFSEAIAYYYQAIEHNPKFHWYHHNLGETLAKLGRFEDAIASFQQAIDMSPNGSSYYGMAQILSQNGQIDQANLSYYRAIELNPNWGLLLVKQTGVDRVIACFDSVLQRDPHQGMVYYDFSLYLAERDLMDDAIKCFQKAPQFSHNQEVNNKDDQDKFPDGGSIYEILWNNLNQLGKIDDISVPIPTKAEAEAYFEKNSNYTIIDINNLTESHQSLLTNYGISLANLQIIGKDDINLEEICINSFNPTPKVKLSRKFVEDIRNLWKSRKNHACCKAMVETSYIYSICPLSGKIIRSNQSFIAHYNHWRALTIKHVYRLDGKEVFYLVIDTFCMGKMCIYMPEKELIITWSNDCEILTKTINALKTNLVSSYHKVQNYIQNESEKKLVFDIGFNKNFGHYYWNELSGILYLQHNDILEKVEKFLVGHQDFFNVGGVFPEIPSHKITKLANNDELFQTILDNNYFAVQVNDLFMSQELADRVTQFSLKKCSENPEFLEEVERAKKHFPLLCIQIRSSRTWVSQVEGNANIIKKLAEDFPNLGVVFDGWSRLEGADSHSELMITKDRDIMNQIIALMPPNIKTYCSIGRTTAEEVVFAHAIDVYSAPLGSGMSRLMWIATKPGVIHSHTVWHDMDWCKDSVKSSLIRENVIPPIWVPRNYIVDLPDANYDCNWSAIYEEIVKIARELSPR